ncbi:hypothetical protein SDC9_164921 [bioreactor metagenome]|uniref:Uncharacterized protein n=1 Tax=bioreactor metagenome TaxID=1076179 RepID=A0A645FUU5_9ZZZZ
MDFCAVFDAGLQKNMGVRLFDVAVDIHDGTRRDEREGKRNGRLSRAPLSGGHGEPHAQCPSTSADSTHSSSPAWKRRSASATDGASLE